MKSKNVIIITIVCLVALAIAVLCGCSRVVVIEGIQMKDAETVEIAIGEFSYEGKKIVVHYKGGDTREVDLTEDMIPEAERLKFYKVGEQEITVIYNNRHKTTFKVNVCRHTFEDVFELVGGTVTYDGSPHRVTLNHDLPEGAKLEFEYGNTFTNAGTYNVEGVISKEGYVSKKLTATLVIEQAEYDLSEMKLDNGTFVYDGEAKLLAATGVPAGVNVTYDLYDGNIRVNSAVSAGTYKVVAHFASNDKNYRKIPDKEVTLTIEKADYDMSGVHLEDYTKTFDGKPYVPALASESVLPQGVSVRYSLYQNGEKCLLAINAGEYEVVASFAGNTQNYNPIEDMSAHVIVERLPIVIGDSVKMDDMTVNYDGNVHSLTLDGQLPQGVTVSFENNDQTYAGEYEVVARFSATNSNRSVDVEEIRAYLIINQVRGSAVGIDGREITESDLYYDEGTHTMRLLGLDSELYGVRSINLYTVASDGSDIKIEWGDPEQALTEGQTYHYKIGYYFFDEGLDRSVRLSDDSGIYTYHRISLSDETVVYDGQSHLIVPQYLPRAVTVGYEFYLGEDKVEEAVGVGEYREVVSFRYQGQEFLPDMEVNLSISKRQITLGDVSLEGQSLVYDKQPHALQVEGEVPEGVTVTYTYILADETLDIAHDAGSYEVIATFTPADPANEEMAVAQLQATLTIEQKVISLDGIVFHKTEVTYDGQPHDAVIEGELPEGVSVTFEGNGKVNWGAYRVVAYFAADDYPNETVNVSWLAAILLINKYEFTGEDVVFEDVSLDFDHTEHSLAVQNLPAGVGVEYTNNDKLYAGVYTVTAHFVAENDSVVIEAEDKQATLTINKISEDIFIDGHRISSQDFLYDVDNVSLNIKGFDPELYDYKRITFSWPINSYGSNWLWFYYNTVSPTEVNKLTGKNYSGQEIHYEITFEYHDADLRSSVELNKMTGYCVYNASDNTFTECVSTDDSES